jgi:hypothetical protein
MKSESVDAAVGWIGVPDIGSGGYDAVGWQSNTWVLNAMFEIAGDASDFTEHQLSVKAAIDADIEPSILELINRDGNAVSWMGSSGLNASPGTTWTRVRWSTLGPRLGAVMSSCGFPPCWQWFPMKSWPENVVTPTEGSLDLASLKTLLTVLREHSLDGDDTLCCCYYSLKAMNGEDQEVLVGTLGEIFALAVERDASPSNFWPEDRSWFVYTDSDLWGTKVSGSISLVEGVRQSADLETIEYP